MKFGAAVVYDVVSSTGDTSALLKAVMRLCPQDRSAYQALATRGVSDCIVVSLRNFMLVNPVNAVRV